MAASIDGFYLRAVSIPENTVIGTLLKEEHAVFTKRKYKSFYKFKCFSFF